MFRVLLVSTYELGRQPFGLASPAAWLRREGMEVRCADLAVEEWPETFLARADLVAFFIPMHTATRLAVPRLAQVRQVNPKAHICCYGLYGPPNEAYLRRLGAGAVLGGEYEAGLRDLAVRLRGGDKGGQREPVIDLQRMDFVVPERADLPGLERYARLQRGAEQLTVGYTEASRGCRHRCRHCPVVPVYGGRFRVVQAEVVLDDIRQQVAAGAGHISFGDPDFFNGPGHAVPLVEALHREFPQLSYDVTIKVEHLLRCADLLAVLQRTGCAFITSAVEAVDDRVLQRLDKGHTRADFLAALELCRAAGLVLNPTFVAFTPWTTIEGYIDMLRLLVDVDLVDQVAPVQLAIRLLLPAGSLLLELEEVQHLVGPFDEAGLGYSWTHPDPQIDLLSREILHLVQGQEAAGQSRRAIFAQIWRAVHRFTDPKDGADLPPLVPPAATIPYLTEPWYC